MQKFRDEVQNLNGDAVPGASVLVKTFPSGVDAVIYSNNSGSGAANPLTTDAFGAFEFYAADGHYQITISGPGIATRTITDIRLNDADVSDEWALYGPVATYIGPTSFSVTGDQRATFQVGRRLKTTNTAGTVYSTIATSVFGAVTTVTVVNDASALDTGLSEVRYGVLASIGHSVPGTFAKSGANSDITSLSGLTTPLSLAQGGTGAVTAAAARTNLGATALGSTLFTSATAAAARAALASGALGDAVFLAATAAVGRAALGSGVTGDSLFLTATPAAARTAIGLDASVVPFTQAGVGAVPTNTEAKLRQIEVSPEDFGAALTYNAAVDDRLFLQKARDAIVLAGGGTVVLNRKYALNTFESGYNLLLPASGVSWRGKGIRTGFRVGNGLRSTSQGIAVLYDHTNFIFDITYENFTVDFNGQNNLLLSGYGLAANTNRFGGAIAADVDCRNMWFKNSGGHHFVYFGLAATDARNDNCSVTNCRFYECGQSIVGATGISDHSSIYMGSTNGKIQNNWFVNTTQCLKATAIEFHESGTVCTDNFAVKYNHGCNFGGDSNSMHAVVINDNTFREVVRGIVGWTFSAFVCDNVNIHNNTITLYDTEGTAAAPGGGIIYSGSFDGSTATSSGWRVTGNSIEMAVRNDALLTYPITGIDLNPINGLTVTGNTVFGLKGEGVRLSVVATKFHKNVLVAHNPITSCGYTTAAGRRAAISLLSNVAGAYVDTNVVVRDNPCVGGHYGAGVDMDYGVQTNGSGQFQNLKILDNEVTGSTIQDIYIPTAQTQAIKPLIRHKTTKAGHPYNLNLNAGWGSTWTDTGNGFDYEFRNKAGTNGTTDGWSASVYANGDPSSTAPFNAVGTDWKRGDTVHQAFPAAEGVYLHRCTASGTGGAAAIWKSAGNLPA